MRCVFALRVAGARVLINDCDFICALLQVTTAHNTERSAWRPECPQDDSHNGVGKGCRFVLYKVGSIIMTVAIDALYLIFVHFYALAFLASCSTR